MVKVKGTVTDLKSWCCTTLVSKYENREFKQNNRDFYNHLNQLTHFLRGDHLSVVGEGVVVEVPLQSIIWSANVLHPFHRSNSGEADGKVGEGDALGNSEGDGPRDDVTHQVLLLSVLQHNRDVHDENGGER